MGKWRILFAALLGLWSAADGPGVSAAEKAGPPRKQELAVDPNLFTFSPEVVADTDGTIHLAHSVFVADEMGATDFHQGEALSERIHARKVFVLESADVTGAELFFFGSARQIHVNGKVLEKSERLTSTGWTRAPVPAGLLKSGENEVVFSGGGSLLLEPSRQPGRSFKSSDGGRTWSTRTLGSKEEQQGEYLVRLRLGRYPSQGWALSPVLDLWTTQPGTIASPARLTAVMSLAGLQQAQADGSKVAVFLRTGSTPTPEPKSWTDWIPLDKDHYPADGASGHRWAQLKFDLSTTQPQATPRLPSPIKLTVEVLDEVTNKDKLQIVAPTEASPAPRIGSVPFVYQAPSPRLKLLRERYKLDEVIAPGKTEMEQLMLLRHWVRNQWHTAWGSHPAAWMPPWDALMILESKDQPDCLTMCTHYAAVFTQCCLALGWNARHCILDHHCVAEVWVEQHHKWVMMDAGNSAQRADVNLHFERDGVPQSALELHVAQQSGKTEGLTVCFTPAALMEKIAPLCRPFENRGAARPERIPVADLPKYPVCGVVNFRRYAFPSRNNYLASLLPGELYQGWSEYFYDGYCWVGDSPDEPRISPEYSRLLSPARPQDIDWSINWTRIHLCRTGKSGELQVTLETMTPNLARLEKQGEKDSWQPTEARFVWKLQPGVNTLRVRSVNAWGKTGGEARVQVRCE